MTYKIKLQTKNLFVTHSGRRTMSEISDKMKISYPTVLKYATSSEYVDRLSMIQLVSFLVGSGMTLDEVRGTTLGELFSIEVEA
jgi:hypothetical protein